MYEDVTYEDLLDEKLAQIPDTLDKRPDGVIYNALAPNSAEIAAIYLNLSLMWDRFFAGTATEDDLDNICKDNGFARKVATYAERLGEFTFDGPDSRLESGTRFRAGEIAFYSGEETEPGKYKMYCESAGNIGNDPLGSLIPVEDVEGLKSAQLTDILVPGESSESDESLRERYYSYIRNPSTSGNKYDYYNWVMECSGVGDVKVFPLAYGPGTVKLVIADSDKKKASAALIEKVHDHIEGLRPIGANVFAVSVEERPITATAKIKLKNGINLGTVQSAFFSALSQYLRDNAFNIDYISIAKVSNILFDTVGVEDYSEVRLNGNPANIILEQEEVAVCESVSLEVM